MYDNRDLNLMDVIIFKCLIMYVMKIFSNPHFWAWDFECLVSKFQQDITQEFSQLPQFYLWQKKLPNISIFTSGTKKASLFLWSNCPYPWQSAIDRYRWTARGPALVDTTVFPSATTTTAATATALSAVINSGFISVTSVQFTRKQILGWCWWIHWTLALINPASTAEVDRARNYQILQTDQLSLCTGLILGAFREQI